MPKQPATVLGLRIAKINVDRKAGRYSHIFNAYIVLGLCIAKINVDRKAG